MGLLNAFVVLPNDAKIMEIELKDPFNHKTFMPDKESILDIRAKDNFGNLYDIEMQASLKETYPSRIIFYSAKLYTEQISKGDEYYNLRSVISLSFIDDILFKDYPKYFNRFLLRNDDNSVILSDKLIFYIFELPKFKLEYANLSNDMEKWLYLIKHSSELDITDLPVNLKEDIFMEAVSELDYMSKNAVERLEYEKRMKYLSDIATIRAEGIHEGFRLGRKQGIKLGERRGEKRGIELGERRGEKRGKMEAARNMLYKGFDINIISDITGLSREEIERLK
jgi:predicted transposase/invertase (TIGR01784 family)